MITRKDLLQDIRNYHEMFNRNYWMLEVKRLADQRIDTQLRNDVLTAYRGLTKCVSEYRKRFLGHTNDSDVNEYIETLEHALEQEPPQILTEEI